MLTKIRSIPRFRDMNPLPIAIVGIVLTALVVLVALQYDRIPLVNQQQTYKAQVSDAAGLRVGDDVRVAGLEVGKVEKIGLEDDHVLVTFTVKKSVHVGDKTGADIKTESLLGKRGLTVRPAGERDLGKNGVIPLSRTTTPYALTDALDDIGGKLEATETETLGDAIGAFAGALEDTPPELAETLDAVSRLSETISSRDTELRDLLTNADSITDVLAERSDQLNQLVLDSDALFAQLDERRQMLGDLIVNIGAVSTALTDFIRDNETEFGNSLDQLDGVLDILIRNQENIQVSLDGVSKYMYALGDSVSNGPYFTAYIQNFLNLSPLFNTTDVITSVLDYLAANTEPGTGFERIVAGAPAMPDLDDPDGPLAGMLDDPAGGIEGLLGLDSGADGQGGEN